MNEPQNKPLDETWTQPSRVLEDFHGIMTCAPVMKTLFTQIRRVARSEATVLVRGATGTGKELVARALHELSPRRRGPFQAINCATLTPEMLVSELFGHERGAFTGAIRDRQGLFALAHTGTIFLDEIAEIPLAIQARLLRVLQERSFVPLGATKSIKVDVRVISATHRSLREEVQHHRFREDLMYRVRVVPLFLPTLASREGDVEALLWHFLKIQGGERRIESIAGDTMGALLSYAWPGNVRELHNVVEYALAIGVGERWTLDELPPEIRGEGYEGKVCAPMTVHDQERERILEALQQSRGRKGEAAKRLEMSRSTLWRKMREHHLT